MASETKRVYVFDVFDSVPRSDGKVLAATLYPSGYFRLNKPAANALGNPRYVELMYAAESNAIGIRATTEDNPTARKVSYSGNSKLMLTFGAALFLRQFNIPRAERPCAFVCRLVDNVLMFEIDGVL